MEVRDFQDLPATAVAKALSRLAQEGSVQRVAKGVYYHPEQTSFGPSMPSGSAGAAGTLTSPIYPAGLTAANALGLSSQNPYRAEYATIPAGQPKALRNLLVHTGRPAERQGLSTEEGAILEVLRERARSSDLPPRRPHSAYCGYSTTRTASSVLLARHLRSRHVSGRCWVRSARN